jgi:SWI/SNF-related matrix-associated actin-dependent regulator of chromatin subfamily A containing DEAD/H box 1
MGVSWVGFTGATKVEDRQVLVDQFTNDPSITVFLLSTKAGGLGINLTAANWVILYDQDFNPQNDKQAMDRSYRLGQKKEVTVVRLICKGTIDQSIYELGTRKLELANRVSDGQTEDIEDADDTVQQEVATGIMAGLRDMDAAKGSES